MLSGDAPPGKSAISYSPSKVLKLNGDNSHSPVGESLGILSKRSRGGKVSILTILVIAVILIGAYFYFTMGTGGIRQAIQGTLPPDIEITSTNTRSGAKGLDYVGYVDISVYNSGGKGTITVARARAADHLDYFDNPEDDIEFIAYYFHLINALD